MPHPASAESPGGGAPGKPDPARPLVGYELLLGVTGGIAAYKVAAFVSRTVQAGCGVTVAMTRNARRFVGADTFAALSNRPVLTSLWARGGSDPYLHLHPSESADLILVAPATANVLGKLANGIADDLVSTLLLGAACPILLAPAMNPRMWAHPAVQRNIARLHADGCRIVGPDTGWLACGDIGAGRMSEPEVLLAAVTTELRQRPPRSAGA